ncbi:MAG: hypothetical protein II222_05850 [Paraprevotella sp.]|nr:hypothetical protein [Paraprevotella sp.]
MKKFTLLLSLLFLCTLLPWGGANAREFSIIKSAGDPIKSVDDLVSGKYLLYNNGRGQYLYEESGELKIYSTGNYLTDKVESAAYIWNLNITKEEGKITGTIQAANSQYYIKYPGREGGYNSTNSQAETLTFELDNAEEGFWAIKTAGGIYMNGDNGSFTFWGKSIGGNSRYKIFPVTTADCEFELPFTPTTVTDGEYAKDGKAYKMTIRESKVINYDAETSTFNYGAANGNSNLFTFTQDGAGRIKIYNITAGTGKAVWNASVGSGTPLAATSHSDITDGGTWDIYPAYGKSNGVYQFYENQFVLRKSGTGTGFMHDYLGNISYWDDGPASCDGGSFISVTEAECVGEPTEIADSYYNIYYTDESGNKHYLVSNPLTDGKGALALTTTPVNLFHLTEGVTEGGQYSSSTYYMTMNGTTVSRWYDQNSDGYTANTFATNAANTGLWHCQVFLKHPITGKYAIRNTNAQGSAYNCAKFIDATTTEGVTTLSASNDATALVWTIEKGLPVELSSADNKKWYAIKSGRTNQRSEWYYTYNNQDKNILLLPLTYAVTTQYWFFNGVEEDGKLYVTFHPYDAPDKAMSYKNGTGDAANKITAETPANTISYWNLVNNDGSSCISSTHTAPYGMRTKGNENYLSNNGGIHNKLGFWHSAPNGDAGSAITFVPVEDLMVDFWTEFTWNNAVGYSQKTTATDAAIATLNDLLNTPCDFTTWNNARAAFFNSLETILPQEGKYYYLQDARSVIYTEGYSGVTPSHPYIDDKGLTYWEQTNTVTMKHLIQFEYDDNGKLYMKNAERGTYLSTNTTHSWGKNEVKAYELAGAKPVQITPIYKDHNYVHIIPEGGGMLHKQADENALVAWNNTEITGSSSWFIQEVDPSTMPAHELTVGAAEWSTLFLGYPTEVPEGVTAYTVAFTKDDQTKATLVSVDNVIPACTPVIISAPAKTYDFKYTAAEADDIKSNLLKGTGITTDCEARTNYTLQKIDGEICLGLFTGTSIPAFKAYMPATVGSNIKSFQFAFDEVTGIEDIQAETNAQPKAIYDLSGRRVMKPGKGIYLSEGKVFIVK